MQTRFAGMTDTGLLREHNEDSLLLLAEYGIVAVADGMGGHRSGDVASQLAISTLSDFFSVVVGHDGTWPFPADPNLSEEENYVVTGLRLANRRIFDRSLRTMAISAWVRPSSPPCSRARPTRWRSGTSATAAATASAGRRSSR